MARSRQSARLAKKKKDPDTTTGKGEEKEKTVPKKKTQKTKAKVTEKKVTEKGPAATPAPAPKAEATTEPSSPAEVSSLPLVQIEACKS